MEDSAGRDQAGVGASGAGFGIADDRSEVFAQLGAVLATGGNDKVTIGANFDTLLSGDQQICSSSLRNCVNV